MNGSMGNILIVEDDPNIRKLVRVNLVKRGYTVSEAEDSHQAMALFQAETIDLVLLDLVLPGLSGVDVCAWMRARSDVPIIVLSARSEEDLKVAALDAGADDYVTKPFSRQELLLRVQAVLRRAGPKSRSTTTLRFGDIQVDTERGEARRGEEPIPLTALEYRILLLFLENRGKVLSLDRITESIWGPDTFQSDRVVYTHINNLRGKIEPSAARPRYIVSLRGLGYRFDG